MEGHFKFANFDVSIPSFHENVFLSLIMNTPYLHGQ